VIDDATVLAAVDGRAALMRSVIEFVHGHAELGHEEFACARHLAEALAEAGLTVEAGSGGMQTAFRAVLEGGRPGRRVGVVALYDAVPAVARDGSLRPTHSCGHGPIAGSVTAAAAALAELRAELPGSLVVIGCPADEIHAPGTVARAGGKLLSLEAGLWNDVDVALYCHPEFLDTVNLRSLWMRRDRLVVAGARSLRDDAAQEPLTALRELVAATESQPASRLMLEHVTFDGDVEEGTGLYLEATVLLFADDAGELETLTEAVRSAVPSSGWSEGKTVQGVKPDAGVTAAVAAAFVAAGRRGFVLDPPPLPFATDFGNISHAVPAALMGVGREGGWAFHTDEGATQFASEDGFDAALTMARVLSLAVVRLGEPPGVEATPSTA
jgi:metal-dependent amidase/aminoacylase/carboxypeptidase family protein